MYTHTYTKKYAWREYCKKSKGKTQTHEEAEVPKGGWRGKAKEQENREKKGEMERHKEQRDTEAHRAGKRKENGPREARKDM